MASNSELYNILGVDQSASDAQIRSAYERMVAEHPEGTPMHERIVQAYDVLSDMERRALYDVTGKYGKSRKRIRRTIQTDRKQKVRYTLNTLFLAGAAVTTVLFILQWSGAIGTAPFYWACSISMLIKISEFIVRLIP